MYTETNKATQFCYFYDAENHVRLCSQCDLAFFFSFIYQNNEFVCGHIMSTRLQFELNIISYEYTRKRNEKGTHQSNLATNYKNIPTYNKCLLCFQRKYKPSVA